MTLDYAAMLGYNHNDFLDKIHDMKADLKFGPKGNVSLMDNDGVVFRGVEIGGPSKINCSRRTTDGAA
jgi:hypothetical protein